MYRLTRNFHLEEFPCWQLATPSQVQQLRELTQNVLQPARDRWGPIVPTSWRWWSSGCVPREWDHARGAVDVVPLRASTAEVARWLAENLHGSFGKVLDEHDHLHVTPPGVGSGRVYTLANDGGWIELEYQYGTGTGRGPVHAGGGWGLAFLLVAALALSTRQ